jgi:hypothetical protein
VYGSDREMRAGHDMRIATEAIAFIIVWLGQVASMSGGDDVLLHNRRQNEVIGRAELRKTDVHDCPQQEHDC